MDQQLRNRINDLRKQLTGDMYKDMDTRDKIHRLEMQLNGVKPSSSQFNCFGCGS